jgi:5-methylcytosine-specific restriction endonuclease McrBC GTP-binding regulatory subunit McrB
VLKSAVGNEFRVNQMGPIYRDYNVMPGDEVVFTHIQTEESSEIRLNVRTYNRVVINKSSDKGADISNVDRVLKNGQTDAKVDVMYGGAYVNLGIEYIGKAKKRSDSPTSTDFYSVHVHGQELPKNNSGEAYYLTLTDKSSLIILPKQEYNRIVFDGELNEFIPDSDNHEKEAIIDISSLNDQFKLFYRCMRTKPFLLLAGISGTGKSRIVKQIAFDSCSKEELRKDPATPGNYCLIEVQPSWHDSTELLGYESQVNKSYKVTKFVKFLFKAMNHHNVPFFVCLDEMNLAPVEQYFAEYLSVLESRKLLSMITSDTLIEASVFDRYKEQIYRDLTGNELPEDFKNKTEYQCPEERDFAALMRDGLRLPPNLIVIGTVNMDETTHQFSRKVIDRAMTIEMNIGEGTAPFQQFFDGYQELGYRENPLPAELFLPTVTSADEALRKKLKAEDAEFLKQNVPTLLNDLNTALNNTPFKVAYRVQNELVLYFAALRQDYPDKLAEELLRRAMDDILMMKVLPRIQGDEDMLEIPLKSLAKFTDSHNYSRASEKIKEMNGRLEPQHFTSFWP